MQGIRFLTDENGQKVAVQLDLRRYGGLWEDLYDQILVEQRVKEKRELFAAVEKRLRRQGRIRG